MRFRRFLLALVMSALPSTAAAQGTAATNPLEIYLVAGLNVAKLTTNIPEVSIPELSVSTGSRLDFIGGVLLDWPLTSPIAIETGGLLSIKGLKFDVTTFGERIENAVRMTYLDVPALVRVGVAKNESIAGFLLAGPTLGVHLSSSARLTAAGISVTEGISDGVNAFDLGLTIGGRVQYKRFIGDVRYTFGLLDAFEAGFDGTDGLVNDTAKHRVLSFMGGWKF